MRSLFVLLLVTLAACPQGGAELNAKGGDDLGDPNSPAPSCADDTDCELAGKTCCECKTFALPVGDPKLGACDNVQCPPPQASCSKIRAACERNQCVVKCDPQVVTKSCTDGYAKDMAGCLVDACAQAKTDCTTDNQCVRTRADCCGCLRGGKDTAVPLATRSSYDMGLNCGSSNSSCPEVNTCAAETAQCAQGECRLIEGAIPADACGRADLPACPVGKTCTVNANATADKHGVGVCL